MIASKSCAEHISRCPWVKNGGWVGYGGVGLNWGRLTFSFCRLYGKIEVMDGGWNNHMKQASRKQWWSSSKIFSKMCSSVVARVTSGCTKFYFFGWSLKETQSRLKAHWLPVWVVLPTEREDLSSLGILTPLVILSSWPTVWSIWSVLSQRLRAKKPKKPKMAFHLLIQGHPTPKQTNDLQKAKESTLLGTNISPTSWHFWVDDFPFRWDMFSSFLGRNTSKNPWVSTQQPIHTVQDVMLARQVLMNCVPSPNKSLPPPGCDGGDPWMIHQYLQLGGFHWGNFRWNQRFFETCWEDFMVRLGCQVLRKPLLSVKWTKCEIK